MSVIQVISTPVLILEPLASKTYLSVNVLVVEDKNFSVAGFLTSTSGSSNKYRLPYVGPSRLNFPTANPGINEPFYDNLFLTSGSLIVLSQTVFIDIGNVDSFFTYGIWNGYETNEDISNITYSASVGIAIIDLSIGDRFYRFSEAPFTIKVDGVNAIPVFNLDITITTTNYVFVVTVVGTRAANVTAFLSWANWQEPVSVTHRWPTAVSVSGNNTEARRSLADRPTRNLDYTSLFVEGLQTQQAWSIIQSMAETQNYLPLIYDASFLTADAGGSIVLCDTTERNFQVDYFAVLCHVKVFGSLGYGTDQPTATYFPMLVQAITTTSITFYTPLPETFQIGDVIFPAIYSEAQYDS